MAWLGTWAKRIEFSVNNAVVDDDLPHFGVLLHLSAACGRGATYDMTPVFDELENDGNRKKIAITKADGTTELYVEIEKWDHGNLEAWLWVSKADWTVLTASTTPMVIYYDKTQGNNDAYVGDTNDVVAENVWDANFKGVWHMRDGVDNEHIYDSTLNDRDGTKTGAGAPAVTTTAIAGEAQDYDGDDDYINLGASDVIINSDDFLIEIWLNTEVNHPAYGSGEGRMINFHRQATASTGLTLYIEANIVGLLYYTGAAHVYLKHTVDYHDGVWHHIAVRHDTSGTAVYKLYYDGAEVESNEDEFGTFGSYDAFLGSYTAAAARSVNGILDEARVSDTYRTAAWVAATYETSRDNMLDFGSEEEIPAVGDIDTPAKRRMAAGIVPFHSVIIPDGTIGLKDRMQIACLYSENAVATPVGVMAAYYYRHLMQGSGY